MSKVTDELLNDFHQSMCRIDFDSYNPRSAEFENCLHIGLMWKLLKEMGSPEIEQVDAVREEIDGAKKYWEHYKATKDMGYRTMADDELRHAEMLLTREFEIPEKKKEEYKAEIANLKAVVKGVM